MEIKKLSDLKNKKIVVMGLGLNDGGVGITNFLLKHGAHVVVTDLNSQEYLADSLSKITKSDNLELVLGSHRDNDFLTSDIILRNPAVPRTSKYLKMAEEKQIPIEMESTLFFKLSPTRNIIAVTGTKGKTTTSYLIYEMLKACGKDVVLAGNMRISMVEQLERLNANSWVVLELSSFQIEGMIEQMASPFIGVYTNILQDHLDRYKELAIYAQVKKGLIEFQTSKDYAVINLDDSFASFLQSNIVSTQCFYSESKKQINISSETINLTADLFANRKLVGAHNYANLLAAYTVGKILKLDDSCVLNSLNSFKGVPHRLEFVLEKNGVTFINDTAATMPDAALAALEAFKDKNPLMILGGKDKNLDFSSLIFAINAYKVPVILIDSTNTGTAIYKSQLNSELILGVYDDFALVVKKAYERVLVAGGTVLLSPGCASPGTNMFLNEFDRGDKFKSICMGL